MLFATILALFDFENTREQGDNNWGRPQAPTPAMKRQKPNINPLSVKVAMIKEQK